MNLSALSKDDVRLMMVFFVLSLVASGLVSYPLYRLLLKLKSRQIVSEFVPEHAKKMGTPTMGGLIIVIGYLLTYTLTFPITDTGGQSNACYVAAWLFLSFGFIGFTDDFIVPRLMKGKRGLGWKQKLGMEVLFAWVAIRLLNMYWYEGLTAFDEVAGGFLILFFSNAYNFSDGMDWLAGIVLTFMALGLFGLCLVLGIGFNYNLICMMLLGTALPFLVLNAPPAKIFMGDVGSLPIGAVLGLIVFQLLKHGQGGHLTPGVWLPVLVISLVMIVELVPVPLQVASVKIRKKRLFPFTPIHHAFERAGWKESRVVLMFGLTQLAASAAAVGLAWVMR